MFEHSAWLAVPCSVISSVQATVASTVSKGPEKVNPHTKSFGVGVKQPSAENQNSAKPSRPIGRDGVLILSPFAKAAEGLKKNVPFRGSFF